MLYQKYDNGLAVFLKSFDNIFTTNYDSNLESITGKKIYHIHGQFDRLSETYNPDSFRNHLNDNPLEGISNEPEYQYLHSTALSTYCGDYKKYQINQNTVANIRKKNLLQNMRVFSLLSHSIQDWTMIIKEYNSLTLNQRNAIVQEEKLREELLKEKLTNPDNDMYLTCSMVNLNIVASQFNIDPNTVCLCISPLCDLSENIIVV